jgi:hypothetical protein
MLRSGDGRTRNSKGRVVIDRFTAESLQFAKELPEEARQTGLELGRALGQAVDDIPELEAVEASLEGAGRQVLKRHLSTLHVFRRFVERAETAVECMPKA